ncbi:MAG: HAMP domain-containing sensor histidine kinase [Fulvivirga sp.]
MFNKRFLVRIRKLWAIVRSNGQMLLLIFMVSTALLLMNYYTIRIQSGIRAYVNGESYYSKGQKDAARYLALYIQSHDPQHWELYKENMSITLADGAARQYLQSGEIDLAQKALLQGNNHEDDLDQMTWLFVNFKNISFMEEPINLWTEADSIIKIQDKLAHYINDHISSDDINSLNNAQLVAEVHGNSAAITVIEKKFLKSLGDTARKVSTLILIINTILTLVIIGGAGILAMRLINRLIKSEDKLMQKNNALKNINAELDRFVYSASHDLRAPINSLKGLIKIARGETDNNNVNKYFGMMDRSLEKQDNFIKKIISFSRNKRLELTIEEVDLDELVTDVFHQLQFMPGADKITLIKSLSSKNILADPFRLEVILTNLFSNAIKFIDPRKAEQIIEVTSRVNNGIMELAIRDNGLGISDEHKEKIFDMFYMTTYSKEGSGVGLYIVKETISKMGGSISVESAIDEGTTFYIHLPLRKSVSAVG